MTNLSIFKLKYVGTRNGILGDGSIRLESNRR